jgi:hypothetical protein
MKLIDLAPQFIEAVFEDIEGMDRQCHYKVDTIAKANGIRFHCPRCMEQSKLPHWITILSAPAGAPAHAVPTPIPGRFFGTDFNDLTFAWKDESTSPISVAVDKCNIHLAVIHGLVRFAE